MKASMRKQRHCTRDSRHKPDIVAVEKLAELGLRCDLTGASDYLHLMAMVETRVRDDIARQKQTTIRRGTS